MGVREQIKYKYGATDFYFVAVLTCDTIQDVAVEDVREVKHAKWVNLDLISDHNSEIDPPEYFFFQTPYEFIRRIKQQLALKPEGESVHNYLQRVNWGADHEPTL